MQHQLLLALHQLKSDEKIQQSSRNSGYCKAGNLQAYHGLSLAFLHEFNHLICLDHVHALYEENNRIFQLLGTFFKDDTSNSVIAVLKNPSPANIQQLSRVAEQIDSQYRENHGSAGMLLLHPLMTCAAVFGLVFKSLLGLGLIPLAALASLLIYPCNTGISPLGNYFSWIEKSIDSIIRHADATEEAFENLTYNKTADTASWLSGFFQVMPEKTPAQEMELDEIASIAAPA